MFYVLGEEEGKEEKVGRNKGDLLRARDLKRYIKQVCRPLASLVFRGWGCFTKMCSFYEAKKLKM